MRHSVLYLVINAIIEVMETSEAHYAIKALAKTDYIYFVNTKHT